MDDESEIQRSEATYPGHHSQCGAEPRSKPELTPTPIPHPLRYTVCGKVGMSPSGVTSKAGPPSTSGTAGTVSGDHSPTPAPSASIFRGPQTCLNYF